MTEDRPAKDEEQVARRRRMQADILERVTAQWNEHEAGLSMNQLTKLVSGAAQEIIAVAKDMGNGPQFPVELVPGQRKAVILQPTRKAR